MLKLVVFYHPQRESERKRERENTWDMPSVCPQR